MSYETHGGGLPVAQTVDADCVRADMLRNAEEGDFVSLRDTCERILGRRYGGVIPLFPDYVPKDCPTHCMPVNGCHARGKIWTESFVHCYLPGLYVAIGPTPTQTDVDFLDTSGLSPTLWRGASGKQPTIPGFEKKDCAAEYSVGGPTVWSMKGIVFYREERDMFARWNQGFPIVHIFQVGVKQARVIPQQQNRRACLGVTARRPPPPPPQPQSPPPNPTPPSTDARSSEVPAHRTADRPSLVVKFQLRSPAR